MIEALEPYLPQIVLDYWPAILGVVLVGGYIIFDKYRTKKKKLKAKELKTEEKDFVQKQPTLTDDTLERMEISKEFVATNNMEESYTQRLIRERNYIREEIEEKKELFKKAKEKFQELLDIDRRLKFHISHLETWETTLTTQIERDKGEADEGSS